jgi:hypothetical protein
MSAAERNRELAADLARRAIAAAERRQAEAGAPDPGELAERFRGVADEDGRLSVDDAINAVTGSSGPVNPFAAEYLERQARANERLGLEPERSNRPQGDGDGGKGEDGGATYEQTEHGFMRVWSPEELANNLNKETNE